MIPKVYLDTTVLKFSATQLPRLRPKKQKINWGGQDHELTVHDFVHVNPNDSIDNPELKAEAELLPSLAEAGKTGRVNYVIQVETLFESWGIPKMDSETGKFYDAPCEYVEAPIKYSRVLVGAGFDARDMQSRFLSSLKSKRFLELQKITGAYQGPGKLNRNQLLDAFHLWCAEHNSCDYFLTLDSKLIKVLRKQKGRLLSEVVKPSELMNRIGLST
jgi:hypothetical protein